jgi:hypothetical protein
VALLALADRCTATDRALRPGAAEVARAAWDAAEPRPVRLARPAGGGGADDPDPAVHDVTRRIREQAVADPGAGPPPNRRHRRRLGLAARRGLRAVGVLGVVALLAVGGYAAVTALTGRAVQPGAAAPTAGRSVPGPSAGRSAAVPSAARSMAVPSAAGPSGVRSSDAVRPGLPSDAELVAVVGRLAAGRAAAFRTASVQRLATVDEPGSPAMAQDAGLVGRLTAAGLRLDGLVFTVADVRVATRGQQALTVTARVTTSAHRQLRRDGTVVAAVPASTSRTVRLVLVPRGGGGWLIRSASASAP